MTEAEWDACTDPVPMLGQIAGVGERPFRDWASGDHTTPMLQHISAKARDRKLRLFAVACGRRVWHRLSDERSRKAVEVGERYADGAAGVEELQTAVKAAAAVRPADDADQMRAWLAALAAAPLVRMWSLAYVFTDQRMAGDPTAEEAERKAQSDLLRCVLGNPFRPKVVSQTWLAWNDGAAVKIATIIYHTRTFDRLPLFADALEDAGCT